MFELNKNCQSDKTKVSAYGLHFYTEKEKLIFDRSIKRISEISEYLKTCNDYFAHDKFLNLFQTKKSHFEKLKELYPPNKFKNLISQDEDALSPPEKLLIRSISSFNNPAEFDFYTLPASNEVSIEELIDIILKDEQTNKKVPDDLKVIIPTQIVHIQNLENQNEVIFLDKENQNNSKTFNVQEIIDDPSIIAHFRNEYLEGKYYIISATKHTKFIGPPQKIKNDSKSKIKLGLNHKLKAVKPQDITCCVINGKVELVSKNRAITLLSSSNSFEFRIINYMACMDSNFLNREELFALKEKSSIHISNSQTAWPAKLNQIKLAIDEKDNSLQEFADFNRDKNNIKAMKTRLNKKVREKLAEIGIKGDDFLKVDKNNIDRPSYFTEFTIAKS